MTSLPQELAQVALLELLARGGTIAIGLFLAMQFLRAPISLAMKLSGSLFMVAVIAFTLAAAPLFYRSLGVFYGPLKLLAVMAAPLFWIFAQTLFNDRYRFRWVQLVPLVFVVGVQGIEYRAVWHEPNLDCILCTIAELVSVALFLHVPFMAFEHLKADLIESRRNFRWACGLLLPVIGVFFTGQHVLQLSLNDFSGSSTLLQSVILLVTTIVFALWFTTCTGDLTIGADAAKAAPFRPLSDAVSALELERLEKLVQDGVCLEEGLTIGGLAEKLNMPEHRLRLLINKGLGYRNFPAFLNDHRVAVAKRWLADPSHGREQILQMAYALGYASLAPFNRAFRERVGLSPTEFRNKSLQGEITF